ncbi:hypothetical protein GCM10007857_83470 [Bradyrhizobium iriomotense]|uniref:Uncharacterized protein n=1 Tax=Bradyrhizobium iriomotense TaxID=441950 RepID=A0ABQ6BB78_9BRAD|nr:hypothetical protein GCM10007857_83470 [Bradyrhizobium iriomotense]
MPARNDAPRTRKGRHIKDERNAPTTPDMPIFAKLILLRSQGDEGTDKFGLDDANTSFDHPKQASYQCPNGVTRPIRSDTT